MRVTLDQLSNEGGIACYKGKPFDGVAYRAQIGAAAERRVYVGGVEVETPRAESLYVRPELPVISKPMTEGISPWEDEYTLDGVPATGVRVIALDGLVVGESCYESGKCVRLIKFAKAGDIKEEVYNCDPEYLHLRAPNGTLFSAHYSRSVEGKFDYGFSLSFIFKDGNTVSSVAVFGKAPLKLEYLVRYIEFLSLRSDKALQLNAATEWSVRDESDRRVILEMLDQVEQARLAQLER